MRRTTTKEVKAIIKAFVMENYDGSGFDEGTPEAEAQTFEEMARVILADVKRVNGYAVGRKYNGRVYSWQMAFCDWCAGLPNLLDTSVYYCGSAVDLLGEWLDETEEEKVKYTETEAETMIDSLLYREISKVAFDVLF